MQARFQFRSRTTVDGGNRSSCFVHSDPNLLALAFCSHTSGDYGE